MAGKSTEYNWLMKLGAEIDSSFGKALNGAKTAIQTVGDVASKVGDIAGTALKGVGIATGAVVTGAVAAGKELYELGSNFKTAANDMAAATGTTGEELAALQQSMQDIYASNFGEDFADIGDALSIARRNTGLMGDELENLTQDAIMLRDTFDYDVAESTRAAEALMENFGITGEEAMNLIASGAQNGLDFSGEMIDTINEYSVQFSKLGMDAETMFAVMKGGADGTAWNLDKVGDSIKEFSIRAIDGSDSTKEAFEAIGLHADTMAQIFASGGEAANTAFYDVLNSLLAMEDPVARDAAGVQLFGTMWEDMGVSAMQALADTQSAAYDAGDALQQIEDIKYDDFGNTMESFKRQMQVALLPAAQTLMRTLTDLAPTIGEVVSGLAPMVEQLMPVFVSLLSNAAPLVSSLVSSLLPMAQQILPVLISALEQILPVVISVVEQLMPVVQMLLPPLLEIISALLPPLLSLIELILPPLISLLQVFTPIVEFLAQVLGTSLSVGIEAVSLMLNGMKSAFEGLLKYITGVFTGDWELAWQGIGQIFEGIMLGLEAFFKVPINGLISVLNWLIEKVNGLSIDIPEWVPGIGGQTFGFNIPLIPELATGGIVDQATLAMIGEGSEPEAVMPLSRLESMLDGDMGGQTIYITYAPQVTLPAGASRSDMDAALQDGFEQFKRWMQQYEREGKRLRFG